MGIMRHLRFFLLFFIISIFGFSQNTKSVNHSEINIEFIDAKDEFNKKDLIQNGGILKVPCLRVETKKNQVH